MVQLVLDRSLVLSTDSIERITQASAFYANRVLVRASAQAQSDDAGSRRLRQLADIGAIRTWAFEYETDESGRVKSTLGSPALQGEADHVLTLEQVRTLVEEIDEELALSRDDAYEAGPALREGVSEVVQLRHNLATMRVSGELEADGVLATHTGRGSITQGAQQSTSPIGSAQSVVSTIVDRCSFGALRDLPIQAILDCREQAPAFKEYVDVQLRKGDVTPGQLADRVVRQYQELTASRSKSPSAGIVQPAWQVVGAALPATVITRALKRRITWFKSRDNMAPFVLLSTLHEYAI